MPTRIASEVHPRRLAPLSEEGRPSDTERARVRLVATDIDGTLLPYRGTVSARTRSALTAVVDRGVHLVYATGRPPRWMPPIVDATGHAGLAICANGAIVIETSTGSVVEIRQIPADAVRHAAATLRRLVPDVRFALETPAAFWVEDGYLAHRGAGRPEGMAPVQAHTDPLQVTRIEDAAGIGHAFKVVAITQSVTVDEFFALARAELTGPLAVTASSPGTALVELAAPGVTKGSALSVVAADLGIPAAEVAAFGDMPNDVEMLRWAGRSYAIDGGHPAAMAAAPRTAPPAAEDGVAQVLEGLITAGHIG